MSFFENTRRPVGFGGMTICNADPTVAALTQAGFSAAEVDRNSKGRICVTAKQ